MGFVFLGIFCIIAAIINVIILPVWTRITVVHAAHANLFFTY